MTTTTALTAQTVSAQLLRTGKHQRAGTAPSRTGQRAARIPGFRCCQRFGAVQIDYLGAASPEAEQDEIEALARTLREDLGLHVTEITVYGAPGLQVTRAATKEATQ